MALSNALYLQYVLYLAHIPSLPELQEVLRITSKAEKHLTRFEVPVPTLRQSILEIFRKFCSDFKEQRFKDSIAKSFVDTWSFSYVNGAFAVYTHSKTHIENQGVLLDYQPLEPDSAFNETDEWENHRAAKKHDYFHPTEVLPEDLLEGPAEDEVDDEHDEEDELPNTNLCLLTGGNT
jgi:hypothetical protein